MRKHLTTILAVLAVAAIPVAASHAQSATMTPALKALAEAADKEGHVSVMGSADSWGGPKGSKIIEAHLNKLFGTKIVVDWAPSNSYPETGDAIAVSYRNHLPSPTDVYVAVGRNLSVLEKFDLFDPAPWATYLPDRMTDAVVEHDKYVKLYTGTLGFSYNTEQSPSKPERLEDFLKPEWAGKVATTAFGSGFEQLAAKEAWGPEKTIAFVRKFAKQIGGFMLCTDPERLASGEFLAFATDCSGGVMVRSAIAGAPIAHVITPDNPLVTYGYGSVPKNAAHPNAAKLYIAYLLSKDGQELSWSMNYLDLHLLPGSQLRPQLEALEKKFGFKYVSGDVAWQRTNDAGNAAQREAAKILQESGNK